MNDCFWEGVFWCGLLFAVGGGLVLLIHGLLWLWRGLAEWIVKWILEGKAILKASHLTAFALSAGLFAEKLFSGKLFSGLSLRQSPFSKKTKVGHHEGLPKTACYNKALMRCQKRSKQPDWARPS